MASSPEWPTPRGVDRRQITAEFTADRWLKSITGDGPSETSKPSSSRLSVRVHPTGAHAELHAVGIAEYDVDVAEAALSNDFRPARFDAASIDPAEKLSDMRHERGRSASPMRCS